MTFTIVQGDTAPAISSRLTDGGHPVDISGFNRVRFHMMDEYENTMVEEDDTGRVNVTNATNGDVEYVFESADTETIGTYYAEWEVEYDDGTIETFPSRGFIEIEVTEEIA